MDHLRLRPIFDWQLHVLLVQQQRRLQLPLVRQLRSRQAAAADRLSSLNVINVIFCKQAAAAGAAAAETVGDVFNGTAWYIVERHLLA